MKTAIKASLVLSWINIVIWGLMTASALIIGLSSGSVYLLTIGVLMSSVVLHSYAALKLRKSILDPTIPLANQTSVGIRIVGLAASFLGIMALFGAFSYISMTKKTFEELKPRMAEFADIYKDIPLSAFHQAGIFFFFMGLGPTINVFINSRLLRWYYVKNQRD